MKITFLCPHTKVSGGVKVILKLAQLLSIRGYKVTVITDKPSTYGTRWLFGSKDKIPFKILNGFDPEFNKVQFLSTQDCIVGYADSDPFIPLPLKVKHILLLQGFGTQQPELEFRSLSYKYDAVITTSKWLANLAVRFGHSTVHIVPPGIDEHFVPKRIPHDGITVGSLYHSSPDKNSAVFLSAMSNLAVKYTDKRIRAILLSSKNVSGDVQLSTLKCESTVFVNPPKTTLADMYATCDIWVSPSLNEGFGLTTLEAMACGCAVAWLPSYGLQEFMQSSGNCVFITNTKKSVMAGIETLFSESFRNSIIQNGLELAKKFTWAKTSNAFHQVLQSLG